MTIFFNGYEALHPLTEFLLDAKAWFKPESLQQKLSPQQIQFIKLLQVPTAELEGTNRRRT